MMPGVDGCGQDGTALLPAVDANLRKGMDHRVMMDPRVGGRGHQISAFKHHQRPRVDEYTGIGVTPQIVGCLDHSHVARKSGVGLAHRHVDAA